MLPLAIDVEGSLAGQMTGSASSMGSLRSGRWATGSPRGRRAACRPRSLASRPRLRTGGLHRVEVNIRPENAASLQGRGEARLPRRGAAERYLHIDGAWRDHRTFALTREEVGTSLVVQRWLERFPPSAPPWDGVERRTPRS